jgi:hypothetical protein
MTENRRCGQCGRRLVYVGTGFKPLGSPEEDPEQLHACPEWHEIWSYAPAHGAWDELDGDELLDWKRRLMKGV